MPGLHIDRFGDEIDPHYGCPVSNLVELTAIVTGDRTNKQRRYVASEGVDYFFNAEAVEGDIAPDDQANGIGFWIRDKDNTAEIEEKIASIQGLSLIANQAAQEFYLRNANGETISTISVAFLNNEGTTFFYNDATKNLELKNDAGEILSEIPVSSFISNVAKTISLTGSQLDLKDAEGNILSSVTFGISNVTGLQAALEAKQDNLSTDESFYLDTVSSELRSNISTYSQILTKADSQVFPLDFEPTNFLMVHGKTTLSESDYIFTPPTTFEVIPGMAVGEKVRLVYEHYNTQP